MQMKIKVWLLCLAAAGAVVSGGAAARSIDDTASTAPPEVAVRDDGGNAYWLFDSGGYIAVYETNGNGAATVTDIEVETLNDYDRELLRDGIPAKDDAELLSLLEDLGS